MAGASSGLPPEDAPAMMEHDQGNPGGAFRVSDGQDREPTRIREHRVDIFIVVLLAVSSLLAAWAGHQAGLWSGRQGRLVASAEANQFDATRLTTVGYQAMQIDLSLFLDWLRAYRENDRDLASFYEDRFSPRLAPAFTAWLATNPLTDPSAPTDPFRMAEYQVPQLQEAMHSNTQAAAELAAATEAATTAEAYVLSTILLALVLFFAGVSAKLESTAARLSLLSLGVVFLLIVVQKLGALPDASSWHLTPLWS